MTDVSYTFSTPSKCSPLRFVDDPSKPGWNGLPPVRTDDSGEQIQNDTEEKNEETRPPKA